MRLGLGAAPRSTVHAECRNESRSNSRCLSDAAGKGDVRLANGRCEARRGPRPAFDFRTGVTRRSAVAALCPGRSSLRQSLMLRDRYCPGPSAELLMPCLLRDAPRRFRAAVRLWLRRAACASTRSTATLRTASESWPKPTATSTYRTSSRQAPFGTSSSRWSHRSGAGLARRRKRGQGSRPGFGTSSLIRSSTSSSYTTRSDITSAQRATT